LCGGDDFVGGSEAGANLATNREPDDPCGPAAAEGVRSAKQRRSGRPGVVEKENVLAI
jgi:hypothetical protein